MVLKSERLKLSREISDMTKRESLGTLNKEINQGINEKHALIHSMPNATSKRTHWIRF
jgi:hypothetical protein